MGKTNIIELHKYLDVHDWKYFKPYELKYPYRYCSVCKLLQVKSDVVWRKSVHDAACMLGKALDAECADILRAAREVGIELFK